MSTTEGLHKGYDRFQTILSQLEIHGAGVSNEDANQKFLRSLPFSWSQLALIIRIKLGLDTLSFDDLYKNQRVFKRDVKGTTASSSNTQNINDDDMEEIDLKWQLVLIRPKWNASIAIKWVILLENVELKGTKTAEEEMLGSEKEVKSCSKACEESYARLKKLYDDQSDKLGDAIVEITAYTLALKKSVFMNKASDLEDTPVNNRFADGMHAVPPPMTGNYMPSGPNVEIDYSKFTYGPKQTSSDESDSKPSEYAFCKSDSSVETSTSMPEPVENASKVVCEPKVWTDARIIKEYESDSNNDSVSNVQEDKEKPSFVFTDSVKHNDPHRALKDKGIIDSGYSMHIIGNKAYLVDYQEFKGSSVSFGGSNGRITGKGKTKTDRKESNTRPLVRPRQ
nr:ribonuclease H-like domain-containing protein [Tanacetum cinerariifolium]